MTADIDTTDLHESILGQERIAIVTDKVGLTHPRRRWELKLPDQ